MVDTQVSKTCERKLMRVRLSPRPPLMRNDRKIMWVTCPPSAHFDLYFVIIWSTHMNQILTEHDLENLFSDRKRRAKFKKRFNPVLLWLLSLVGVFIIVYTVTNFESLKNLIFYKYYSDYGSTEESANTNSTAETVVSNNRNLSLESIDDNSIYIKSISVSAPIAWDVRNESLLVAKNLENGVIHLNGTAHPGEIGNVFITGHSSNYLWAPGKYKSVFSLLNQLVVGDLVQIKYKNKDFLYKVSQARVVKPTDLSVMDATDDSVLTLMTCTPVGTSLNRLIITANQIYPDKNSNIDINKNTEQNRLPNVR